MKVLIAEDDCISCRALAKNAEEWGYEVVTAKNGEEAWKALKKEEIHLAILDWMMPRMDGVELCRKIRQEYQDKESRYIYIILLTGRDQQEDIIKGLSEGADDYITKPFDFPELKVRLENGERIIERESDRIKLYCCDRLTKLWTKDKIIEILDKELNRGKREYQPTGALMLDIDHFTSLNKSHGQSAGDAVLYEVASRLKRVIRRYDEIGRYGGDEMLVVLSHCSLNCVKQIAERLRNAVCENKIQIGSGILEVTISLGGTSSEVFSHVSRDIILEACTHALSLAKKQGWNNAILRESPHIPTTR